MKAQAIINARIQELDMDIQEVIQHLKELKRGDNEAPPDLTNLAEIQSNTHKILALQSGKAELKNILELLGE